MFKEFFTKEVFTALSRPMIYVFMFIVGLLVFGAVVSDNVVIGGVVGDIKKNAPAVVAQFVGILGVFSLLFATAFFNNAALRDHKYGFNEILFSSPISKAGYFFGRFLGAWKLSALVSMGIFLAFIVGPIVGPGLSWIEADRFGPTPWAAFASSFLLFVLPNMFLAGSIIFFLATKFKNTIISFVGTLVIIIAYIVAGNLTSDIDNQSLAAAVDMFGLEAYRLDTQYYSPLEKNTLGPLFAGHLLVNRLIWIAVGCLILLASYLSFSFSIKSGRSKKKGAEEEVAIAAVTAPAFRPSGSSQWQDFKSFFGINFRSILKSPVFIIVLLFAIILQVSNLWGGFEYFGLKSYPVTYKMLDVINGISGLFVLIVLVFFSGELVWRDRDSHINEVIDGTPHGSLTSILAKTLSLVSLAVIIHLTLVVMSLLYQAASGYFRFELDVYLIDFFSGTFFSYLLTSFVLVFVQIMVNQKYLGYFISILSLFAIDIILLIAGIETNMLSLGGGPSTIYSDMNGFGPGMTGKLWFGVYWTLFGSVLLILGALFWPRGTNSSLGDRLRVGKKSIGSAYKALLGTLVAAFVIVAGIVYYNTQVLNDYDTSDDFEQMQISYEQKYKKYQDSPKMTITDATYTVDIYPEDRRTQSVVALDMVNKTSQTIDTLYFTLTSDTTDQQLELPGGRLAWSDEELGFLAYAMDSPILPGGTTSMTVTHTYEAKGFENGTGNTSVIRNGTFFNNGTLLPEFGYSKGFEIGDKNDRRKFDLPERERMPELQTQCSDACMKNYLSNGVADWVNMETYISTSTDQIAVAPGRLVSEEERDGRRYYHYKIDQPSQHFMSFISADFEVARRKWKGIDIEVYYHEDHATNVPRMLDAVEKALAYYTANFGPYYHDQARILEFPRYSTFAQAFPGTMPYSESFGFIIDLEGENKNNVIDAVIAHEMAHQYWAHQVIGAEMQGGTMLSESFAEYSSLMVMKQETDPIQMKDFLKYDLQRYLRGRSSESEKEQPLMKVENQTHIHYGKGSVILYALQDYIGEDRVNAALQSFLEEYRYAEPPYPTSNDFMRHLRPVVPDSLQYLLTDWFEEITFYDLRLAEVKAEARADGQYDVTIDVTAKKVKAQPDGEVSDAPIADWVDVGFFSDRDEEHLMMKKRVYLGQEETQLTFTLDSLPARAAVDPMRILIDRLWDDNRKTVSLE